MPDETNNKDISAMPVAEHLPPLAGVVVGDDGSRNARAAVEYAVGEASRRDVPLHVLRSWSFATAPRPDSWEIGYMPPMTEWEAAVLAELEQTWGSLRHQVPDLQLHPAHVHPAEALIEQSVSAAAIVVGSRGRGRMARLVLGSVAEEVARRARCPVVIVPYFEKREPV